VAVGGGDVEYAGSAGAQDARDPGADSWQATRAEARARPSSWATAPVRNPPPGCFAEANTRQATSPSACSAAASEVCGVTVMSEVPVTRSAPVGSGSSG
jgi:hypothetical protein